MKTNKKDPYDVVLTKYEQDIEDSFARGEWISDLTPARRKEIQAAAARFNAARKSKSVTFRITPAQLDDLKARAKNKNMPYQTLLGTIINDYLEGKKKISL